ncbi:MAG: tetratricopeptide repeat protein [Hyphomicrobiales bacterium]
MDDKINDERDQLRKWPYTIHAVDETLDIELIESRGKQLLYRSLNNQNIVAFVGSGISQAYGRLGWYEWIDQQLGEIDSGAQKFVSHVDKFAKIAEKPVDGPIVRLKAMVADKNYPSDSDAKITKDERRVQLASIVSFVSEIKIRRIEIKRLHQTFEHMGAEGASIGQELPPVRFQVAEHLHNLLESNNELFKKQPKLVLEYTNDQLEVDYKEPAEPKHFSFAGNKSVKFSKMAKLLLVDEIAHAENILANSIEYSVENGRTKQDGCDGDLFFKTFGIERQTFCDKNLRRDIVGVRDKGGLERYAILGAFKTVSITKLVETVREHLTKIRKPDANVWLDILTDVSSFNDENIDKSKNIVTKEFISPIHRFIVGMLIGLLEHPMQALGLEAQADAEAEVDEEIEVESEEGVKAEVKAGVENRKHASFFSPVEISDFKGRQSIIDKEFDPLSKIVMNLGVRQFLTLNYDFEIERLFQDRGYKFRPSETGLKESDERIDGLGGRVSDGNFTRENAASLISHTLDQEGVDASIFHLHGQATKNSEIIITERDYMNLYVRDDRYRDVVDDSIRLAFSASPLLFMGLGMDEADVLRPLRQFMSDKERSKNRTAIVLMDGSKDKETRAKSAATLFLKYGAHVIYYGDATVMCKVDSCSEKTEKIHFDWLHRITKLITVLRKQAKTKRDILLQCLSKKEEDENSLKLIIDTWDNDTRNPLIAYKNQIFFLRHLEKEIGVYENADKQNLSALALLFGFEFDYSPGFGTADNFPNVDVYLQNNISACRFEDKYSASQHEKINTDWNAGEFKMQFECALLTRLTKKSFDEISTNTFSEMKVLLKNKNEKLVHEHIRDMNARIAAFNGLQTAFMTGAMTSSLDEITDNWKDWWEQWVVSPPNRVSRFAIIKLNQKINEQSGSLFPLKYIRHHVDSVITNYETLEENEQVQWLKTDNSVKNIVTGVRSFDNFVESVQNRTKLDLSKDRLRYGRRFHIVASQRGYGKGSFLSAFVTDKGLAQYMVSSWPNKSGLKMKGKKIARPEYLAAIFVNLSFSTEISSNFDSIINVLIDYLAMLELITDSNFSAGNLLKFKRLLKQLDANRTAKFTDETELLLDSIAKTKSLIADLPRLKALKKLLRMVGEHSKTLKEKHALPDNEQPRLLLAFNAFELFYYTGGNPKNREVKEFVDLLTSDQFFSVPFDLIIITNEAYLGAPFVKRKKLLKAQRVGDENEKWPAKQHEKLVFVPSVRANISVQGIHNVRQREIRSNINIIGHRDFAAFGKHEEFDADDKIDGNIKTENMCTVHFSRVMKTTDFLIDNFFLLALAMYINREEKIDLNISIGDEIDKCKGIANLRDFKSLKDEQLYTGMHDDNEDFIQQLKAGKLICPEGKSDQEFLKAQYGSADSEEGRLGNASKEWLQVRAILKGNRFCITILLAAAEQIVISAKDMLTGGRNAELFIRRTIDHVKSVSVERREEIVLHDVLDVYDTFHEAGKPQYDVDLHLLILRHLAVIGTPCSADVLVRTPDIRNYFNELDEKTRPRTRLLLEALTSLTRRGLIFRIHPHPQLSRLYEGIDRNDPDITDVDKQSSNRNANQEFRYVLHRLTQLHIIRKMGATPREFGELKSFAPTLYSSMPAELPRLSQNAYHFLNDLVANLSQYPDQRGGNGKQQAWVFAHASIATKVQALRAAFSVVHSTFSVAVVSRFDDHKTINSKTETIDQPRGYFETYRIQVRWLIRKAWELLESAELIDETKTGNLRDYSQDKDIKQISAFYRDEIVWLYNEVGVICLVQGNLRDAVEMFRQALDLNRNIEGNLDGGAQHNRVALNLAITQLERGKLKSAKSRFLEICKSEESLGGVKGRVWYIAHGYLGLIHHFVGDLDQAENHYKTAMEMLRKYNDVRACSIFARHMGDLLRRKRKFEDALSYLEESIGFAESGGHEDLHNKARLAIIRLEISTTKSGFNGHLKSFFIKIKKIEEYAETMEMPALLCDAYHVRASLLVSQGETSLSGSYIIKSMAIAKRNDLGLRLNAAMVRYAQVLIERELPDQAERLLVSSLEFAKRSGNQLTIEDIEMHLDELY